MFKKARDIFSAAELKELGERMEAMKERVLAAK